ncbi:MAG: hypothetical protein IT267_03675 [Saprospiraceae bacterium]|nr:hypothetical protein [Saprospiraceae bacterium]
MIRLFIFTLFYHITIYGQSIDSTSKTVADSTIVPDQSLITDSTITQQKNPSVLKNIFKGKAGKALSYSFICPGLGHIYNKKWWKLPIVYGAFAVPVYFIAFNTKEYKRFDKAFRMRVDLGENSKDEFQGIYNLQQINVNRKYIDKNLQRSYLGLVGVYLLCGIDAFVDRHLMEFDVSEKLSLQIRPSMNEPLGGIKLGLCIR